MQNYLMVKKAANKQNQEVTDRPLSDFISKYRRGAGYVYRAGLLDFFDFINGKRLRGRQATPEDMILYERFAVRYLADKKRKHADDVVYYAKHLSEKGVMPKTAHTHIVAVKEFFLRYGMELDKITEKDVRRLKPKGGRRTDFEYIDRKTLSEILHHFDARGKAFVLVLASSGMRISEVLALSWSDLKSPDRKEYPDKPASVFIRDSKTGHSRTTFITRECEDALKEWRKVYEAYRIFATQKSHNLKSAAKEKRSGDNRVFPFTLTSAYKIWDSALQKAGYRNIDLQTRRVRMNVHRLRNFFSVQVASAAGQQVSELLLGHTDTYGGAYTGRSTEELEAAYKKAESALTIGATSPLLEKHTTELHALRKMNADLLEKLQQIEQKQQAALTTEQMVEEMYKKFLEEKRQAAMAGQ